MEEKKESWTIPSISDLSDRKCCWEKRVSGYREERSRSNTESQEPRDSKVYQLSTNNCSPSSLMIGTQRVLATWDTDCVFQPHLQIVTAINLSSETNPSIMYFRSVLKRKEYAFLLFLLHTGWNSDVITWLGRITRERSLDPWYLGAACKLCTAYLLTFNMREISFSLLLEVREVFRVPCHMQPIPNDHLWKVEMTHRKIDTWVGGIGKPSLLRAPVPLCFKTEPEKKILLYCFTQRRGRDTWYLVFHL